MIVFIDRGAPHYRLLLERIHRYLAPKTYVEIGLAEGMSFRKVLPETLAVGIDPVVSIRQPLNSPVKLFALESDEFFARHDLRSVLNGQSVDLAFIDGMHLFEFALRDFMNLERFCSGRSTILVHDCYPRDSETSSRERTTVFWTGDVWKVILCLSQYRPDLRIGVVDVPQTGLGVISNLDPDSSALGDNYVEICRTFIDLDYSELDDGKDEKLKLVPNDWDVIRALLPVPASTS
jgi:hypothetical protein